MDEEDEREEINGDGNNRDNVKPEERPNDGDKEDVPTRQDNNLDNIKTKG